MSERRLVLWSHVKKWCVDKPTMLVTTCTTIRGTKTMPGFRNIDSSISYKKSVIVWLSEKEKKFIPLTFHPTLRTCRKNKSEFWINERKENVWWNSIAFSFFRAQWRNHILNRFGLFSFALSHAGIVFTLAILLLIWPTLVSIFANAFPI